MASRVPTVPALAALLVVSGCVRLTPASGPAVGTGRDRTTSAAAAARTADLEFSAASVARDPVAFHRFLEEDAVFVSRDGALAGRAAVGEEWAPLLTEGGPSLRWAPTDAEAAPSGDLVFTWGEWVMTPPDGGTPRTGRYLTVWRKGEDGRWRVALDGADAPLPGEAGRATRQVLKRVYSADDTLAAAAGLLREGERDAGAFLELRRREGQDWRTLATVGVYRPAP